MKRILPHIALGLGAATVFLGALLFVNAGGELGGADPGSAVSDYSINSPYIPDKMDFAGEQVPLDQRDVYERLDREFVINTYWHSNTILNMKRSSKFLPEIAQYIKEEGIPEDFKYLVIIESGLTNATSPAGARGFWQFLDGTAKDYGLEVNQYVDERYNLEKSTRAACAFIRHAYEETGSWTLAAASYNRGIQGIKSAMDEQKQTNYYNLYLNTETWRYVPRLLAVKYIFQSPTKYGFGLRPEDTYRPTAVKKVKINHPIPDLVTFSKEHGTNYKELKLLNPWLISDRLPNKDSSEYTILIPR